MTKQYILTEEQFKQIHGALWYMDNTRNQLANLLHPDLIRQLTLSMVEIRTALQDLYREDKVGIEYKFQYFQEVKTCHGLGSEWSIFDIADIHQPHPYAGARAVTYLGQSRPILGTTWFDLWQAADGLIIDSGDQQHKVIESFELDPSDLSNLNLVTGA